MLLAAQAGYHLVHKVVDIEKFQLHGGIVHGVRQVVCYRIAEGGNGAVVIRTAPFTEKIRETVHQHTCARILAIFEEEILPRLFGSAVLGIAESAGEAGLLATGEHHRTCVAVLFQSVNERGCKAEIPGHELILVLRAVHPCQVKDEIAVAAPDIQLLGSRIQVILKYLIHSHIAIATRLAVTDIFQLRAQVFPHEALGAGNQYLHAILRY